MPGSADEPSAPRHDGGAGPGLGPSTPDAQPGTQAASGPELLARLTGRHVDERMYRYVDMVATAGVERGLLGPREAGRLWERHILNCAALGELVPAGAAVADIGSGAGLPGLVLALVRPDLRVTLVEPLLRRATFLGEAVDDLGLGATVEVARVRAEDYTGPHFDVVTARAVAPLDRLAALARPLLGPAGVLLAIKGRRARDEVAAHAPSLTKAGVLDPQVVTVGEGVLDEPTTVVVLRFRRRR